MKVCCGRVNRMLAGRKQMGGIRGPSLHSWCLAIALILLVSEALYAGTSITGKVRDADGRPLNDVTITNLIDNVKTFSNAEGEFAVPVGESSGTVRLLFESPGYDPETLQCKTEELSSPMDGLLTPRTIIKKSVKVVAPRIPYFEL